MPGRLDDLYKKSMDLVHNFCKLTCPSTENICEDLITDEILTEHFEDYGSQVINILTSRRVGVLY